MKVFLLYAPEDRTRVEPIVDALRESGWQVDSEDRVREAGGNWPTVMETSIPAADAVLLVWSSHAADWPSVVAEALVGLNQRKLFVARRRPPAPIPPEFSAAYVADLTNWNGDPNEAGFAQLRHDIELVCGLWSMATTRPIVVCKPLTIIKRGN